MEPARFEAVGAGSFRVSGDLDFARVPDIWEISHRALDAGGGDLSIDLGGVTRVDSAALALVVEWLAVAAARGRVLRIVGAPDKLMALARISEIEGLLAGPA
jgi:phospholipid transport system transporter-binding protein